MKRKSKVPSKVLKEIKEAVKHLPEVQDKTTKSYLGRYILSLNNDMLKLVGVDRNKVEPNRYYNVPTTRKRNHRQHLKSLVKKHGIGVIDDYVKSFIPQTETTK